MRYALLVIPLLLAQDKPFDAVRCEDLPQDRPSDLLKNDGWKAVRAFVEKGTESKAALEEAAKSEDSDIAFYAKAALAEIDARAAADKQIRLTKEMKEAPAKDVIAELFKAMEQKIALDGIPDKATSIPAGLTIVEALEKVSVDVGVEFNIAEDGQWHVSTVVSKGPRFVFGQFRAHLEAVRRTTQNEFDKPIVTGLTYSGVIEPDASFKITDRYPTIKILEAVDDSGANLKKNINIVDRYGRAWRNGRETNLPFTLTVAAPEGKATKISKLRLSTELSCEKKRDVFTFEKVLEAKGVEKTLGSVTATIKDISVDGQEYKVELEITAKTVVQFPEWDTIKLTDDKGGEYQRWSSSSSQGGKKANYRFGYRNPGGLGNPATFTFSMVTETLKRTLYFEFRDVPLK